MVERAAAGEVPSSPQPPEAGARRARFYGALSGAENRNRQTMPSRWCAKMTTRSHLSADFEHVADLSLTARRFLTSLLRGLTLSLADEGKSGAKVLILNDRPL